MPVCRIVHALIIAMLIAPFPLCAEPGDADGLDLRVLIDISGSMKNNDPGNLRRSALRLLVGLLPEETRAGVWTFGQYVNMQIPLGKVDEAWRGRARKAAGKIHSRGLFTNIEAVLDRSSRDWNGKPPDYPRHIILLTDGMVDVSKRPAESDQSRARILSELLPRLREDQVKVHTIALSERADHELMQTLSRETGGWYEQVEDAGRLQRVFMRLFEKVGHPDTVPLKDNRFRIDGSVSEATLLVFHSAGGRPSRVATPSGKEFGAMDLPTNVQWHRDEGYDLLTISNPEQGEWRILAETDPDNRVLVVTDLKMHTTELPSRVALGERLPLTVHFTEAGRRVTEQSFLELITVQARIGDGGGAGEPQQMFDDGQQGDEVAGDGRFTLWLGQQPTNGLVELILGAEGKTFQREQRQTFHLVPSYAVQVNRDPTDAGGMVRVVVTPVVELLEPGSISVQGRMVSVQGEERPVFLLPSLDGTGWETAVDPASLTGVWHLGLQLSAKTVSGGSIEADLEPVVVEGLLPAGPPEPIEALPPVVEADPAPEREAGLEGLILFTVGNLLLVLAVTASWLIYRRSGRDRFVLLAEE